MLLYFGNTTSENTEVFYEIIGTIESITPPASIEGQGMDGYIKDATVKLTDYTYGPNLYSLAETTTDNAGNYNFDN